MEGGYDVASSWDMSFVFFKIVTSGSDTPTFRTWTDGLLDSRTFRLTLWDFAIFFTFMLGDANLQHMINQVVNGLAHVRA